jgi:hypothetical protein
MWSYWDKSLAMSLTLPYVAAMVVVGMAIIPLSIDQKGADAACMSFPWLLTIGFSLTFSAL